VNCAGGIQLGINAKGECLRHWFETLKEVNQVHERWHVLSHEQYSSESWVPWNPSSPK